jgi:hypothetical protein
MSARAKNCAKSACAIEKAQHLNKNHLTSTKHNSKIATFKQKSLNLYKT